MGANVAGTGGLESNSGLSSPGVKLHGSGFIVTTEEAKSLGLGKITGLESIIRDSRNGRDLTQSPRGVKVIDLFNLGSEEVRQKYPAVYQWVSERVKPERDQNKRAGYRINWWVFGEARRDWRSISKDLPRYIATVETTKHRIFQFLDASILPDNMLVNIASDSPAVLGVLSSRIHFRWANATGGSLGAYAGDVRYNKTRCFETFPFPALDSVTASKIGNLSEAIDNHRKRQQTEHPDLTLTGMYNVLEKLRAGEELTGKEKTIHQQGLVSVLWELHDDLDRVVFKAYGWPDLAGKLVGCPGATTPLPDKPADQAEAEEELLMRLVDLNKQRALEEAQGIIRWLRPDYQAPDAVQQEVDIAPKEAVAKPEAVTRKGKATFPKAIPEQLRVLREALAERSHTIESLAELFKRKPRKSVEEGLRSLAAVGIAEFEDSTGTWHSI